MSGGGPSSAGGGQAMRPAPAPANSNAKPGGMGGGGLGMSPGYMRMPSEWQSWGPADRQMWMHDQVSPRPTLGQISKPRPAQQSAQSPGQLRNKRKRQRARQSA